jgi:hypothetical protein
MKGDFSRLTFRSRRHYTRVLQQQGRLQLDADWNEQVAILLHQLQMLTGDLTGDGISRSGAPAGLAGFEINGALGEADNFTIARGRYYVDGLCCECDEDTSYAEQPFPTGIKPDRDGISLVYLDAWEAVVSPLDDPALLEPALSGNETTLRARVVWQVRTHRLKPDHNPREPDLPALRAEVHEVHTGWHSQHHGMLRIRLTGAPIAAGRRGHAPEDGAAERAERSGHFRGPENLLYRIEVHEGGPVGQATFKWSRDNGTPLLPLISLDGAVAQVAPIARQAAAQLAPGTWLELSNGADRMLGRSRDMVQVLNADAGFGRIQLSAAPALPGLKPDEMAGVALRRWDQRSNPGARGETAGPKGLPIVEGEHQARWLDIEDGIQVQFQTGGDPPHHYRSGDYWVVPARTADEGILLRSQAPQPPDGVTHHYAPLGLFVPQQALVLADFRPTFQPLAALQDQVNALSDEVEDLRHQFAALRER